jgi:hypothetical protein
MRRRLPAGKILMPDGQEFEEQTFVHGTAKELMETGTYRPRNLLGGIASLKEAEIEWQAAGSLYLYQPREDAKPLLNKAWVRRSVSALDLWG